MKTLPPLEFTLDGPGLTLEQIGAALKHQQELNLKRLARTDAAPGALAADGRQGSPRHDRRE